MIWRPGIYRRYIPNRSIKDGAGEAEALCGRARETSRIAVNPRFGRRFTEEKALRVSELRYRPPVGRDSPGPGAVRPAVRRGVEPSHRDRRPPQLVRNLVRNFPRLQCLPRKMQKFDSPWGYSQARQHSRISRKCGGYGWFFCGASLLIRICFQPSRAAIAAIFVRCPSFSPAHPAGACRCRTAGSCCSSHPTWS